MLVGALLLGALTGCSDVSGTGDLDYVPGDGRVIEVDAADREDPVEISGETVQGDHLDLADLRGQVVVVNMWWSNCGPCIKEMPMLVEAESELPQKDTEFVGINIRDLSTATAEAFERSRGVDYPSIYDPGSETLARFGSYEPYSPPATLVLDREGRVAALINGPVPSKTTLTALVEELVAEESADG
ncbi:thiol-disulfide isomerase/thioredoxin [Nocardioides thalensis]|uniref:Thiol-disulfide isomerase/thioredoxin n=1 Tax=Nocardioides thalensis TaxID=1914755 RepID=A0A853BXG2_9ACTN|nr:thiol-disulfide isomerase/thioredoxin [Nocardioides thalensis]